MMGFFPQPEPWMLDAACARVDYEMFFPDRGQPVSEAKKVCLGCVSRDACLQYALVNNEHWGVWGGKSERERNKLRKAAGAEVAA